MYIDYNIISKKDLDTIISTKKLDKINKISGYATKS